jgi:Ca2+-transporting ATPase
VEVSSTRLAPQLLAIDAYLTVNCSNRRLDNKFNIFEGLTKNWFFIGISIIMIGGQVLIVMVGGRAFNIANEKQTPAMWAYAIILGFLSIPIGIIIRLIPDSLVARLVPDFIKRKAQPKVPGVTVSNDEERFEQYPLALADLRDELAFLKRMKGGRINNLKFAMQNPRDFLPKSKSPSQSREHSRSNSVSLRIPQTPTREDSFGSHSLVPTPDSRKRSRSMRSRSNSALGAPTVMAGIIAGSIAAGWSPVERRDDSDFGQFPKPSPSTKSSQDKEPSQPSRHGSSVLGEGAIVDEPQEMAEERPSHVPTLSVPTPKAAKKSVS